MEKWQWKSFELVRRMSQIVIAILVRVCFK